MSLSAFLEVVIGLVFTYLLLSLIATWVNEWIATLFSLRAKDLKGAIGELIADPSKVDQFYDHPLIKVLGRQKGSETKRLPSYIPDRKFALAALDVLSEKTDLVMETADQVQELIASMPPSVKETFEAFWRSGSRSVESVCSDVETWFNDKMDRLSGQYKRRAQFVALIVGLVLAVGLNIDTIVVSDVLYRDPALRSGVVAYVEKNAERYDPAGEADVPVDELRATLESLALPMGWGTYAPKASAMQAAAKAAGGDEQWAPVVGWVLKVVGWLLTGLAVSQGAPFWFDLLKKLVNLRSSGVVPQVEAEAKEIQDLLDEKLKDVKEDLQELKEKLAST